jgi:uncharacterized tellurite resistance protein B-like protein
MDHLYQEKLSHLNDLIKLSRVDGQESPNEIHFINSVADRLGVSREDLAKIREKSSQVEFTPPHDMYQMMLQYHRIIIMMGIDRIISEKEMEFCMDLGIKMNLKPEAIKEILELAIESPRHIIEISEVERIFYKHYRK